MASAPPYETKGPNSVQFNNTPSGGHHSVVLTPNLLPSHQPPAYSVESVSASPKGCTCRLSKKAMIIIGVAVVAVVIVAAIIIGAVVGTTARSSCGLNEFRCTNRKCIPAAHRCNGDNDCEDNSDEECYVPRGGCGSAQFRCMNGQKCVRLASRCDGDKDCADASDERGCDRDGRSCDSHGKNDFQCSTGEEPCIALSLLCNGDPDCDSQPEDEFGCRF